MLLLSFALHGWLLRAAPATAIRAPAGKVALSLGQLRLSSAEAQQAVEMNAAESQKAEARIPPPTPPKPQVSGKAVEISAKNIAKKAPPGKAPEPSASGEPAAIAQAETATGKETEDKVSAETAAPAATAPEIGVGEDPVLVDRPAFASPPQPPAYPSLARQRRQQGTVVIEVQLGRRGEQVAREVLRSSGVDSLDRAALAAVEDWRFLPYRENGRPRQSRVQLPIRFTL